MLGTALDDFKVLVSPVSLAALLITACASPPPLREVPAVAPTAAAPTAAAPTAVAPVYDSKARHAKTIEIPAGSFVIGDASSLEGSHPKRAVSLATFAIDAAEVTVGDYAECVSTKACSPPRHDSPICNGSSNEEARRAVNCVDLRQARAFCTWVGKRLPTEEEWEGAARAGSPEELRQTWPCGSGNAPLTCDVDDKRMLESDTSPLGLVGMAGNVSEWTSTVFEPGMKPVRRLVTKGGSYRDAGSKTSLATRNARAPHAAYPDLGFRCVRSERPDPLHGVVLEELSAGPDLSEVELRERYVAVWKEIFAEQQHLSVQELERSVAITRQQIDRSVNGTSLSLEYNIKVDWATVGGLGDLLLRVDPADSSPALRKLPADRWLEPAEAAALARATPATRPAEGPLPLGKHLKFPSRAAAVAVLAGTYRASFAKDAGTIELARPQWPAKDLYLTARGTIDEKRNECLDVVLNLVTGVAVRTKTPCGVN